MAGMNKQDGAFLTIGELATELGLPQHILRYWETRFPALRPLQRAGNRRYYRPEDVELARTIHRLLNVEGYTVRGAQQALAGKGGSPLAREAGNGGDEPVVRPGEENGLDSSLVLERLKAIRATLETALMQSV